ncbi:hypothetical protein [Neobacillus sp.]|uniref:hypothetical protein n=1 Tax=Neobacillus sp. TaxID=2675273 RepID=UPI0035B56BC6
MLSIYDTFVDLRSSTKWNLEFIESHQEFKEKNHDFENIYAKFSYHPDLIGKIGIETDWVSFRHFIASDFNKLPYPPCHLYVDGEEVTAFWFVPNELLINGISEEEQKLVMKNMEEQLKNLSYCKLEKLSACGGDREISEKLYLEEYYRKNQFIKVLLPKKDKNYNKVSVKE